MSTGIGNRILSNSYTGNVLTESKAKSVENKGTQTDQVLDLSGNPEQIANEISSQDISTIKAIKINNSLVTMTKPQIEKLIQELKTKCLDENNNLKPDIKFANFKALTGTKANINAVVTSVSTNNVEKINNAYNNTSELADMNVSNPGGNLVIQHSQKATKTGEKTQNIDSLITDLNSEIEKLKATPGNESKIGELSSQVKNLQGMKEMLEINKQIHETLKMGDPKAASAKLELLTKSLSDKLNALKTSVGEGGGDKLINDFINKSESVVNNMIDLTHLCRNTSLINAMKTMGKATTPAAIQLYFSEYVKLAEQGQEARKKGKVEGRQGAGETPDAKGFINANINDVKSDATIADKMENISKMVTDKKFSSKQEMETAVRKLFQTTTTGQYTINKDKVDKVVDMFDKLYEATALNSNVESIVNDIHKEGQNLKNLKSELEKAKQTQASLLQDKTGIAGLGFGPKAVNSGQNIEAKSNTILKETGESIKINSQVLDEEIKNSERTEMERVQHQVDQFIENSPSSSFGVSIDSHLHLDISVKAGVGNKYAYAGIGMGVSLDVRKVSTAATTTGTAVVAKVGMHFLGEAGVDFGWLKLSGEIKKSWSTGIFFGDAKSLKEYTAQLVKVQSLAQKYKELSSNDLDTSKVKSELQAEIDKLSTMTKSGDKSYSDEEVSFKGEAKLGKLTVKPEVSQRKANYGGVQATETNYALTGEFHHKQVRVSHSESSRDGSKEPATTRTAVHVKIPTHLLHGLTHKMSDVSKAIPEEILSSLMLAIESSNPASMKGVDPQLFKGMLKGAIENMVKNPKGLAILQKGASTPHVEVVIGLEYISKPYTDKSKPDVDRKSYFALEVALEAEASVDAKVPVAGAVYVGASANVSAELGFYVAIPGTSTYHKKGE